MGDVFPDQGQPPGGEGKPEDAARMKSAAPKGVRRPSSQLPDETVLAPQPAAVEIDHAKLAAAIVAAQNAVQGGGPEDRVATPDMDVAKRRFGEYEVGGKLVNCNGVEIKEGAEDEVIEIPADDGERTDDERAAIAFLQRMAAERKAQREAAVSGG